jgi:hypothetical protein
MPPHAAVTWITGLLPLNGSLIVQPNVLEPVSWS